jgi:hypothetical protein
MRRQSLVIAATIVLTLALTTLAIAADTSVGTWKLNIAKSKMPPSAQAPVKEETMVKREVGDLFEVTVKGSRTDGSIISSKFTYPKNGGAVTFQEGATTGVSLVATMIAPGNVYVTFLQNGKQVEVIHAVVSKDGKANSWTTKGTDEKGKPYEALELWDKQ